MHELRIVTIKTHDSFPRLPMGNNDDVSSFHFMIHIVVINDIPPIQKLKRRPILPHVYTFIMVEDIQHIKD